MSKNPLDLVLDPFRKKRGAVVAEVATQATPAKKAAKKKAAKKKK